MFILVFLILPVFSSAQENGEEPADIKSEGIEPAGGEFADIKSEDVKSDVEEPSGDELADSLPAAELNLDDLRGRITNEAPQELLNFSLKDSNVSLFLTGSWKGTLQANFGFSTSPLGTGFAAPETPLLFTQEADLTLSLWINKRWFVEASFLDDSAMNTYRAGYQGLEGEFVQYAGVGNTGLDFPSFPYLDLGGDSPSSFGFYSRLGNENLNVHTLFRYDAASREEKVFSGGRERTYSYVQVQNPVRGISFVLPDTDIDTDVVVYIEDEDGALRDSDGRRWRLALPSEYAAGRTQGVLDLSIRPPGMVAAAYSKSGNDRPWNVSMGSYSGSAGEFLRGVQQWFSVNLEDYPQCGGSGSSSRPGEVVFNGVYALVIRQPGTFSPFERQNRYDAPSSTSEQADVVRLSSGTVISGFELVPLDTSAASADIPLYTAAVSQRNVYELLPSDSGFDRRDPRTLWPLAEEYPEIYLPGGGAFSGDIGLRFTNYGSTGAYVIGADAVPGSIQVWRSGIQDTNFSYNPSSGEVTLYGSVGRNELIRITFLKRSYETRLGSIAAGLGAVYRKGESPFTAQAALGLRWNLTEASSFTEEDMESTGSAGLSAKAAWDYNDFKAHAAAAFALEQTDTTGLYRAAGMEGNELVMALPPETAFVSQPPASALVTGLDIGNRAGLVYRNYYNNTVLGSNIMPIDWSGASVVAGQNRPYPAKDPQINETHALVAEFSLNGAEKWTGFQVPTGYDSEILSRAGEIEIPYRLYGFDRVPPPAGFKLIFQIGSLSGEDFAHNENIDLIWERQIFSGNEAFDTDIRIARFVLKDEDRLKLGDAGYMRLIAVLDGIGEEVSGRVLLSPPIVRGTAFRPVTFDGETVSGTSGFSSARNTVTAMETRETGTAVLESAYRDILKRLHPEGEAQRVLKIEWENMESGISAGVDGRIGSLPLSGYRELSFFVKGTEINAGTMSFIAAGGPDSISQRQLEAHIPLSAFGAGKWSKVTIRYQGNNTAVVVDGGDSSGAWLRYRPAAQSAEKLKGKSGYIAIMINPEDEFTALDDSGIMIDEIILEDSVMVYRMNAGASVQYSRQGAFLSIRGTPVLADFSVSSAVESEVRSDPASSDGTSGDGAAGSVVNRTGMEISLFGVKISGNLQFTAAKDTFLWSADHGISRKWGPFSIGEEFNASPGDNSARHSFNMGFNSIFFAKFDADAAYEFSRRERKWNLGTGFKPRKEYIPSITVNAKAAWTSRNERIGEDENYGELWVRTWEPMIPDAGKGEDARKTSTQIIITEAAKPVGAVLTFEGSTNFTNANNTTHSENSVYLDVPVVFSGAALNFRSGRGFKRHLYHSGKDAVEDGEKFFEAVNDSIPMWLVVPGYSLFAPELNEAMDKGLENSPSFETAYYTSFNDHFSTKLNLPPVYNLASFVVPSTASVRLERVMEQKLDTRSDMLNLSGSMGFSAINMFGLLGYRPLFKFYQSDEFTHTVEAAVIFPRDEDITWRIQSAAGMGFKGFSGGVLNFTNTLTMRSGWFWLESAAVDWTVPAKKSLLGVFYKWVADAAAKQSSWLTLSSLLNSEHEQLRKESLELTMDKSGDYLRWSLTAGHESIIRILGRLNFSAFVKLRSGEDLKTETFIFDVLLGTTLGVSF